MWLVGDGAAARGAATARPPRRSNSPPRAHRRWGAGWGGRARSERGGVRRLAADRVSWLQRPSTPVTAVRRASAEARGGAHVPTGTHRDRLGWEGEATRARRPAIVVDGPPNGSSSTR